MSSAAYGFMWMKKMMSQEVIMLTFELGQVGLTWLIQSQQTQVLPYIGGRKQAS